MKGIYLMLLALWIAAGTYLTNKKLCSKQKTSVKTTAAKSSAAAAGAMANCDRSLVYKNGDFSISSPSNFEFKSSNHGFITPPSKSLTKFLGELATYLDENSNKTLTIEGMYNDGEKPKSNIQDLGLARAKSIRSFMTQELGIDESQIMVKSKSTDKSTTVCYDNAKQTIRKGARFISGTK